MSEPLSAREREQLLAILEPLSYSLDNFRQGNINNAADAIARLFRPPAPSGAPIPMILHCPKCGTQHIDAPEFALAWTGGAVPEPSHDEVTWENPPHRSHLCHGCGHIWRPADVPTEGVAAIATRGKNDSPAPSGAPGWKLEDVTRWHDLKTWPEFFRAVRENRKPFEVRLNDRDFQEGDGLRLHEWDPATEAYTGEIEVRRVSYMLTDLSMGVREGYAILGLHSFAAPPVPLEKASVEREGLEDLLFEHLEVQVNRGDDGMVSINIVVDDAVDAILKLIAERNMGSVAPKPALPVKADTTASPSTLWIVTASSGEYSDRSEWAVCAHRSEADARAYVDHWTPLIREAESRFNGWCGDYAPGYDAMEAALMAPFAELGIKSPSRLDTTLYVEQIPLLGTPTPPSDGEGEAARSEAEPTKPKPHGDGVVAPTSGEIERVALAIEKADQDASREAEGCANGLHDDVSDWGAFLARAAIAAMSTPSSERLSSDRAGGAE